MILEPAQDELRGVQHLDRKAPSDLHLPLVDGGVGPRTPARRPVADRVGPMLLDQRERGDDVAFGLGHLFAFGIEDPPEMAASVQGNDPISSSDRTMVVKSQVRMMSCAWGLRSIGKTLANSAGSSSHRPAIIGVSEDVAQVSMMSGSPTKPPGTFRCAST